jgi:hypothetical protein
LTLVIVAAVYFVVRRGRGNWLSLVSQINVQVTESYSNKWAPMPSFLTNKSDEVNFRIQVLGIVALAGGVAQWTSEPPQEQKARVRIPLVYKVIGKT